MIIKSPTSKHEFEQLFQLNYRTFAEEIPQYSKRENQKLVDRFHSKNNYLIAVDRTKVIGMISYNTERPFSLDEKGAPLDAIIRKGSHVAEIRLLAVDKRWRKTLVTFRLLQHLVKELIQQNVSMGVISATTRELNFYKKIGFLPFGQRVGKPDAYFQPMYICVNTLKKELKE